MVDARVFFGSGAATRSTPPAKLARRYLAAAGGPTRAPIGRTHGYHGTTASARASAASSADRIGWGPSSGLSLVPHDSSRRSSAEIERVGADRVAAFFCEPVMGAGGVLLAARATSRRSRRSAASTACCSWSTRSSPASAASATWFAVERFGVGPT